jgi:hypothetical protein
MTMGLLAVATAVLGVVIVVLSLLIVVPDIMALNIMTRNIVNLSLLDVTIVSIRAWQGSLKVCVSIRLQVPIWLHVSIRRDGARCRVRLLIGASGGWDRERLSGSWARWQPLRVGIRFEGNRWARCIMP